MKKRYPLIANSRGHRDRIVQLLNQCSSKKIKLMGAQAGVQAKDFYLVVEE